MNVLRPRSLLFLLACGAPVAAHAQGFQLNEIGSCAVARGQAVTASPCKDPSDIYWNPAAAVSLEGWSVYAGIAAIAVGGGFTADTSRRFSKGDVPVEFPPNLFVNYGSKDNRWAVGLGVYVPYGLTSQWDNNFPGRFEALKASLASVYFQPNFAYRFAPNWEIGGGPVIGYSQVQLRQSLDLAQQFAQPNLTFGQLGVAAQTEFARAKLTGSGTAVGFNVGIHGALGPNWDVGARICRSSTSTTTTPTRPSPRFSPISRCPRATRSAFPAGTPIDAVLSGQFAPGQTLSAQKVSTRIKHPAQFQAGVGYSGLVNSRIEGDFEWTQFSSFHALPLTFNGPASSQNRTLLEDYTNSWSVRVGAEHAFPVGIKGRLGFYVRQVAGARRNGHAAAPRHEPPELHDRRRCSALAALHVRRRVPARRHERPPRTHRRTHEPRPDCVRPELRVLYARCERVLAQHPGQLLTPPATHTGELSMSRERNVVAGAVAVITVAALAACNPTKDLVRAQAAGRSAVRELRFARQQHHGRASVRRHQRLDATPGVPGAARGADEHAVHDSEPARSGMSAADRQLPRRHARGRRHLHHVRLQVADVGRRCAQQRRRAGAGSFDPSSPIGTGGGGALTTFILGGKTQVQRALDARPTFVSIWIGNNDVLPAALSGVLDSVPGLSPGVTSEAAFEKNYNAMMSGLAAGATIKGGLLIGVVNVAAAPVFFPAAAVFAPGVLPALEAAVGAPITIDTSCTPVDAVDHQLPAAAGNACRRGAGHDRVSRVGEPRQRTRRSVCVRRERNRHGIASRGGVQRVHPADRDGQGLGILRSESALLQLRETGQIPTLPDLTQPTRAFGDFISLDGVHPAAAAHVAAGELDDSGNQQPIQHQHSVARRTMIAERVAPRAAARQ